MDESTVKSSRSLEKYGVPSDSGGRKLNHNDKENIDKLSPYEARAWIIIFIVLAFVFMVSCYVRSPKVEQSYTNSDATYHVLLTMQAYDQTPISVHIFLPIQTFGASYNKFINNGPSLMMDKYGNNYYVSFSPMGFVAPYIFCKIFHLPLSDNSIYIFNCLLLLVSAILVGVVSCKLAPKQITGGKCFAFAFLVYILQPETMATQGIVYWHQSFSQMILLCGILLFIKDITEANDKIIYFLLLLIVEFLYAYTEWTGYVFASGVVLAYFTKYFVKEEKHGFCRSKRDILKAFIVGVIAILAFAVYFLHFSMNVDSTQILSTMFGRYEARKNASFKYLIEAYIKSYKLLIFTDCILMLIIILVRNCRRCFITFLNNKRNILIMIVICMPVLENIVMMEHAIEYTFDRLKGGIVLLCVFGLCVFIIIKSFKIKQKAITVVMSAVVGVFAIYNVNVYFCSNYRIQLKNMERTMILRDYINEQYSQDDVVLNKQGWRAWGFLQTFYGRNIFCTEIYNERSLVDEALNRGATKIITLYLDKGPADKATYSTASVYDFIEEKYEFLNADESSVSVSDDMVLSAFELNDNNWKNGILRSDSRTILFPYSHLLVLVLDSSTRITCGDEEFLIKDVKSDSSWINVTVDKDATVCAYPAKITIK